MVASLPLKAQVWLPPTANAVIPVRYVPPPAAPATTCCGYG